MASLSDQLYSDCLQALKEGAILLHPRSAAEDKVLYLKYPESGLMGYGYKEPVTFAVWQRLVAHPRVLPDPNKKWLIYRYHFEGEK